MKQRGFSLLEIMIVVLIISGGLLALTRLQGISSTASSVAKQQSEAGFIAQGVIEQLRTQSWTDPSLEVGVKTLPDTLGKSATYTVKYTVSQSNTEQKTVEVLVSWQDNTGQTQYYKIISFFQQSGTRGTARMLQLIPSDSSSSSASSQSNSASSVSKDNK